MAVRLEWEGKPKQVERLSLPFQTVETINESRATREREAGSLLRTEAVHGAEHNQLIWGDNKLVMSSLLQDYAGRIDLIYVDPPFDTGSDFTLSLRVGGESIVKEPSILETHAYRDTWGAGTTSFLTMLYDRLVLMSELLSARGSLYMHCDWRTSHYVRLILDEVFGPHNFRNEIIWKRAALLGRKATAAQFGRVTESIFYYSKSEAFIATKPTTERLIPIPKAGAPEGYRYDERERKYFRTSPRGDYTDESVRKLETENRIFRTSSGNIRIKYFVEQRGRHLVEVNPTDNLWIDVPDMMHLPQTERTGYPTQKPAALAKRIIQMSSEQQSSIVADFFCGSGTVLATAEMMGRRWIGCDLGRFAIHTTRKRLLNVPHCKPFEINNLGVYERQRWQITSGNGVLRAYLDTILAFYRAEPVDGFLHLHGRKANRMVHVGATDAPVTIDETEDVMDEMADNGIEACDLLGWEWEMGLHDTITERARRRGLDVRPRQIPREVMERQVTEVDAVRFFELAYVDLDVRRQGHEACVVLKDFAIPSEDLIPPKVRERVESWSDLIDYWSVDFDFSDEVFHNQWQAYRTRETPALATQSDWHEYPEAGRYAIVVKIIDIFGNDTTKLAEVLIK